MVTSSSSSSNSNGGDEEPGLGKMTEFSKTLKQGERIVAPSRRPDGTLRKSIRIRAGYTPQDEVAIYQSKGALWKKEMAAVEEVPPGYDPAPDAKHRTKSVKRNERKKEKRLQAAVEKSKNMEEVVVEEMKRNAQPAENSFHGSDSVKLLASQLNELTVSSHIVTVTDTPLSSLTEASDQIVSQQDIDKKIRAIKKKIRHAEAQHQNTAHLYAKPEQLDKLMKMERWRGELSILESKKSEAAAR